MAEHQPGSDFGDAPDQISMTRVAQWTGALVSIGLVVGMVVWGYQIVTRDVSGIPVVRAPDGPLRVQPEDPGGRPADNQGLAVNSVVSEGRASPAPDTLILAPAPQDLTAEDAAPKDFPDLIEQPANSAAMSLGEAETPEQQRDTVLGLADELIAQQEENPQKAVGNQAILDAILEAESAEIAPGAVAETPFPRLRPAAIVKDDAMLTSSTPRVVRELAAEAVPSGSRLVQLGAFNSEQVAKSEWDRMSQLFPGYLENKTRVIQQAESGGKTFYRLRAMGFEDLDDARRFCAAFKARNVDCVPVLVR